MKEEREPSRAAVRLGQQALEASLRAEAIAKDVGFRRLHACQRFPFVVGQFTDQLDDDSSIRRCRRTHNYRGRMRFRTVFWPRRQRLPHTEGTAAPYSAASPVIGEGLQRSTGLRAAAVSSRRRRGVSIGAAWKEPASPLLARLASPFMTAMN